MLSNRVLSCRRSSLWLYCGVIFSTVTYHTPLTVCLLSVCVRVRQLKRRQVATGSRPRAGSAVQILLELLEARTSERQGRAIDTDSAGSMEKKKQEGYF